ncbi:MAG: hypothetical protein ABIT83_12745, partial [Massilia sp.]
MDNRHAETACQRLVQRPQLFASTIDTITRRKLRNICKLAIFLSVCRITAGDSPSHERRGFYFFSLSEVVMFDSARRTTALPTLLLTLLL